MGCKEVGEEQTDLGPPRRNRDKYLKFNPTNSVSKPIQNKPVIVSLSRKTMITTLEILLSDKVPGCLLFFMR